jgi:hypothetical protein
MSSPILPTRGPLAPLNSMPSPNDAPADVDVFKAEFAAVDRMLASDAPDGEPPSEVLEQIAATGRISRRLHESGHELRFIEGSGGRVMVELQDCEGKTVRTMKIAEALELAAGKPLS